jgi:cytochrome c oxidase accessory protein FixG
MTQPSSQDNSFRDSIATVAKDGSRIWVYPKKPKGKFTNYRQYVGYTLLAFFFIAPFVRIGGEPLVLLNVLERHFVFFGVVFWPQDFHLFLLGTLAMILFVVLFTVVYGRIFCGWACPQTIFMELVFRKIEYWIEGDWKAQKSLDAAPLDANKVVKKASKHFLFFVVSFIISNLFLTYLIGTDNWWKLVTDAPQNHLGSLGTMVVFTYVFYFVYARFREQVCTTVCPYGRLQGVMLDKNSIMVAYDYIRGEHRSKIHKGEDRKAQGKGDCVDCGLCVSVCPTGTDIRNGTQLECINCTACIDACDEVMLKVGLPTGLIRFASEEGIAKSKPFKWTKRVMAYSIVLVLLMVSLVTLLVTRPDVETSILRTPGMLYQAQGDHAYSNLYNVKVVNKTHRDIPLHFKLENKKGEIRSVGQEPDVKPKSIAEGAFFIVLDGKEISSLKTKLKVGVYDGEELIETVETTFIGPAN